MTRRRPSILALRLSSGGSVALSVFVAASAWHPLAEHSAT
jgi:hypothetical protein